MIRHIVLIKFKADLGAATIGEALNSVLTLKDKIDGILAITVGPNNSSEGLNKGFGHGFVVDFVDAGARDAYLPHPEHVKVGTALVEAAEGGLDGILVLDYEVVGGASK
ncbi:Dabb family protein [Brucella sp. BE17]|uniref:Dabb family protein n=1 Tax=Brucella sp. BE17 TaxID=3142977 RepID=UPI0031B9DB08